ncbi:UbiA family prenyltransferase [Neolewinella agarilytica]|uniref:4-hydroxybenzoate polyprenyltransferase n=1 Tax=Neolewinella agarilytica TaxID=478744 RepID=A0A1H9KAL7_9BACT|nr:UbiA family prenyltransferase [Neolewinella agarilytica]SEQ96108.1 4-hydroxybenzoate polyprenyltransferase [Neolewinella agarilytica]
MSNYPIIPVLRLLRFPNLLVVALTQALVYYRIIQPALESIGVTGVLNKWKFFELCSVTLMITASGYLVNDLQDVKTDEINRPGTNPISVLGRDGVSWVYALMLLGGFIVSQLLAYRLDERELLWIFPVAIGMLSVYSTGMKKVPILGNFLVAAYCAGVPGILLLAERKGMLQLIETNPELGYNCLRIVLLFMAFAFLATLLRELVKDMEDLRGDREVGRRTIPVMWGIPASQKIGILLGVMVIVAILFPIFLGWPAFLAPPMLACIGVLLLALIYVMIQLWRAREPKDYHRLSTVLKFFLLGGLGLLALF